MTTKHPWHLWPVGIIALLWNAYGAFDYVMTHTQNAAHMAAFSTIQLEYFYNLPTWSIASWAIAVWGGVLGAILLLFGKKRCTTVFLISLISLVTTNIYSYVISNGYQVMGGELTVLALPTVIFLVAVSLYSYAKTMSNKGILN